MTRRRNKKLRKGGGKNFIIRGERKDFQRILDTIKLQYEIYAHSTKGVVFNDKVNRFEMNAETTLDMDLINRKHELKLLSSKIVETLPSNHPLLFDLSFTSSELALIQEYYLEKLLIVDNISYKFPRHGYGTWGINLNSSPNTVLVEGNIIDFFGTIGRLRHMSLHGKFDQLIVQRGPSADLIDFVEKSKYLLHKLQSKIRDEIEYQMDIYIYKKIDPFHPTGHIYNETLKYSISFTEDEELFLRQEVGVWYSNPPKATPPPLDATIVPDLKDSRKKATLFVPDYLDRYKAETINETHKVLKSQRKTLARKEETNPYVKLTPSVERISPRISPPVRLSLSLLKQKLSSRAKTKLQPSTTVPRQTSDIEPLSDLNPLRHNVTIQPSDIYTVPQSPLSRASVPKQRRRENSVKKEFYV